MIPLLSLISFCVWPLENKHIDCWSHSISLLSPLRTPRPVIANLHWRLHHRATLTHHPAIFLHFSSFTFYYHNLASVTHFPPTPPLLPCSPGTIWASCCTPTHTKLLKRIIYIAQVWDQSNFRGTLEYTNLRSDISLVEGRQASRERCWERQRIKHGVATAFDLPFLPLLIFKGPLSSHPADGEAWATNRYPRWTQSRLLL